MQQGGVMMNRRDFLRSFALTGGLWVLGESAGLTFAAPDKGTSEWPNHPFLQGNFAPVQGETTADNLKVNGTFPPEMGGMFVRNGPNPQFPPLSNYHGGSTVNRGHAHHRLIRCCKAPEGRPRRFGGTQRDSSTENDNSSCSVQQWSVLPAAMAGIVLWA